MPPRPDTPTGPSDRSLQKSAPPCGPWYPVGPLMNAAGISTMAELRGVFPMNGHAYRQVLDVGLTEAQADRWSVRLGLVPSLVWPEWLEDAERECDAEDCTTRFVPVQAHQRFCSGPCSSRQRRRDRYRADPAYRARRKADARRYYETCGEYVRARNLEAKRAAKRRTAD